MHNSDPVGEMVAHLVPVAYACRVWATAWAEQEQLGVYEWIVHGGIVGRA